MFFIFFIFLSSRHVLFLRCFFLGYEDEGLSARVCFTLDVTPCTP